MVRYGAPPRIVRGVKKLNLAFYGVIGEPPLTSAAVLKTLEANKDAESVRVRINSPGGDPSEAIAIHNMLAKFADVEVDIDGQASSAATLIAMAASKGKLRIADNSLAMVHEARGGAGGTAAEHQSDAECLEVINAAAAGIYAARCGKTPEEMRAFMTANGKWLSAKQMKDAGLADEVTDPKLLAASVASFFRMEMPKPEEMPMQAAPDAPPPAAPAPAPVSADSLIEALAKATGLDPAAVIAMLTDKLDAIAQLLASEAEKDGSAAEQVVQAVADAPHAPAAPVSMESRLNARMVASLEAKCSALQARLDARDEDDRKVREDAENAALDAEVQKHIDDQFVLEAERGEFRAFLKSDPTAARRIFSTKRAPAPQARPEARSPVGDVKLSSMPDSAVRRQAFSLKAAGYRGGDEKLCIARAMELVKEN